MAKLSHKKLPKDRKWEEKVVINLILLFYFLDMEFFVNKVWLFETNLIILQLKVYIYIRILELLELHYNGLQCIFHL